MRRAWIFCSPSKKQADIGLLLLGSTGESLNISLSAKKRIVEYCLERIGKQPVMVGVLGHNLNATLAWLSYLETLPLDAYLMLTPLYARPGDEGQYLWFKTLMDQVSRPVMLYNVPKRTGVELSVKAVERLQQHPNYWSIKDVSGSVEKLMSYQKASQDKPVFCGDDGLFPHFARHKSCGLVSVASNIWPHAVKCYVEQCLQGNFIAKDVWHHACHQLFARSPADLCPPPQMQGHFTRT